MSDSWTTILKDRKDVVEPIERGDIVRHFMLDNQLWIVVGQGQHSNHVAVRQIEDWNVVHELDPRVLNLVQKGKKNESV